MKFARPLLIALGIVLLILAVGLSLALTPSIQRWAVLRAASKQPELKFSVNRVAAGFSSLVLSEVKLEQHGLTVELAQLEMDYSLWQLAFHDRLNVRHLAAGGLVVDASRVSRAKAGAAAAGAPAIAPGLLAQIKLPFELVLDDCQIAGRASLPGTVGQPPMEVAFDMKGGKFAPETEGALRLTATVKNPAADATVGALHAQISLRATETSQRGFSRINLTAVVDAQGKNLSEQNQLKLTAELAKETAGENYSLSIDTLIHGTTENVLSLRAALPAGKNEYAGQWTLKARSAQLEPFFLGAALPDLDARGEGHMVYSPLTEAVGMEGDLEVGANRLEVLDPSWRAIGPVKLQARFDLTSASGVARLRHLNVRLSGDKPVLELSASQAAEIDFNEHRLHVGGVAPGEALTLLLHGIPLAWIAPFVTGVEISGGTITGQFSITGDTDRLLLNSVQPLHIEQLTLAQHGETVLSKAAVTLAVGAVLTDKDLQAKISEFILQTPLGDSFKAQVSVSIPVSSNPPIAVRANYSADLPALLKPWLPKGRIKANGAADLTYAGNKLEIRTSNTNLTDEKGILLFNATTLHPFTFDLDTRSVAGEKTPLELAHISLGRVPLDWLPLSQSGSTWAGQVEPVEFSVQVEGEKISLRASTPFRLSEVALTQDGEPALAGLAFEASPTLEISGGILKLAQTGEMKLRNAAGSVLFTGKGQAAHSSTDGLQANVTFNLEIPALASQPLLTGTQKVSEGRASGEIRATLGAARQIEARLTLNGLVARDGGQLLPVANLSVRAVVQDDGKISLQAPLLLDRAGLRSDLNFSFDVTPAGPVFAVDGKLTSEHVELTDALAVLGVFSASAARTSQAPVIAETAPKAVTDQVSAWSRFNGQFLLDIKSVVSGKEWSMTGLTGLVTINPALISLQKLEASFGEKGRLTAKAGIQFAAGPQPYRLTGDFSLTEFDAGKLFKAIDPGKPPTVEGLFEVAGHFTGNGETVDRTMNRTHGQFELTSRQGVFRGLQRTTGKVSMTSKAVELGASVLGSLLGSEKATKAAEKVAGQAYFVDQLAQSLSDFNYDQLSAKLVRNEALNLTLEDISLISPEIRLIGKGTVTYVRDKRVLEQPMNATLSFAARGKVEQLLGKMHLLDGSKDEVGYSRIKEPISIGGTLSKPDPTAFFTKIATGKLSDLLDSN